MIRPTFELLEVRRMMSAATLRAFDGSGNNVAHADWGSAGATLLRLAAPAYGDGISTPAGASRPSARAISNAIVAHPAGEMPSAKHLSAFAYLWGQFIDHDLDLTNSSGSESFNVAVPAGDASFDPGNTGTQVIPFTRSDAAAGTGVTTPRQQANSITAFLDGSMVYGSDSVRAAALREMAEGRMKTSAGNMLPFNTAGLDNATLGGPASAYFLAGDVRANENVELTSIQTLFVREHNRLAGQIAAAHPAWTDEQIYQQARRLVIGEIQAITYNEFLPALIGPGAIAPYSGYKAGVNAGISTEFSTAAFRLGHSMLADDVEFMDNDGNAVRDEIPLAQAFFNPSLVQATGIDPLMKYLASSNSEEIDSKIVDSLRNFLFGPPGAGGLDLASLNIQRGRDHGLSDYNSTRAALGLPKVSDFSQITSDPAVAAALKSTYGTVDNVDLWVGGLAENHVPGSNVGPTFQRILVDQFTRTRDGDRFWYERDLPGGDLQMVRNTHLSDVIRLNSGTTNVQANVFVFNVQIAGRVWEDLNGDGRPNPGEGALAGRKMELLDASGAVVGSTKAGPDGAYAFEGLELGQYTVRAELPSGWRFTSGQPQALIATRGMRFDKVDFGERKIAVPPPPPPPPPGSGPMSPMQGTRPNHPPPPRPSQQMQTSKDILA